MVAQNEEFNFHQIEELLIDFDVELILVKD